MEGFETRQVGRTPLRLTVLGLGTGTLGGHRIPVTREEGEAVVRAAWSAGVRYFDTAPFYGFGKACRIVGVHPKTGKLWRRGRVTTSSSGARLHYAPVVGTRRQVISERYL